MNEVVRLFLSLEAAAFGVAALIHAGVLLRGYEHWKAATAESVIGLDLALGLAASVIAPQSSRTYGLAAQAFALLGTMVGIFTIAVGVGPRSGLDFALHAGFVILLMTGLILVAGHDVGARAPHT